MINHRAQTAFAKKMSSTPPPLKAPERDWAMRNWKWFVPAALILFVGLFAGLFLGMAKAVRSSEIYAGALERAKSEPAVVEALGMPIEAGFWCSWSVSVRGSKGDATGAVPISGPRGKATIYLVAAKSADVWQYTTLAVQIEASGGRIDLLRTAAQPEQTPQPTRPKGP